MTVRVKTRVKADRACVAVPKAMSKVKPLMRAMFTRRPGDPLLVEHDIDAMEYTGVVHKALTRERPNGLAPELWGLDMDGNLNRLE